MPRRLKLSPLQRDIVMMLEEDGAETVGTVIAKLKPSYQNEFAAQVERLVTLGLVRRKDNNLVLTEWEPNHCTNSADGSLAVEEVHRLNCWYAWHGES